MEKKANEFRYSKDLQKFWDKSLVFRIYESIRQQTILRFLELRRYSHLIDFGCNSGNFSLKIAKAHENLVVDAYDPNPSIKFNQVDKVSNIKFHRKLDKIDVSEPAVRRVILVSNVLEYINDYGEYVDQLEAITGEKTTLCVVHHWSFSVLNMLPRLRSILSKRTIDQLHRDEPESLLKTNEIIKLHENSGYRLIKMKLDPVLINRLFLFERRC